MVCPQEIKELPNFLPRELCSSIIEQTRPRLGQAMVGMSYLRTLHPARNALNFKVKPETDWALSIRKRTAQLADVELSRVENVEVICYQAGGYYYAHNDGVDRTHTLSVYLSDGYLGGDLYFTKLNALFLKIPVGMGLFFENSSRMRHECRTVVSGEKWLLTAWVNKWNAEERKLSGRDPKEATPQPSSIILP